MGSVISLKHVFFSKGAFWLIDEPTVGGNGQRCGLWDGLSIRNEFHSSGKQYVYFRWLFSTPTPDPPAPLRRLALLLLKQLNYPFPVPFVVKIHYFNKPFVL